MILFHFTALHFIEKIKREGLTKGAMPWNLDKDGNPTLERPYQWLTRNSSFDQQWCLLGNLEYSRNAYRIAIQLPDRPRDFTKTPFLFKWEELCRRCRPDCMEEVNKTGGDVDNWFVFRGRIPPHWFIEVKRNNGEAFRGTPGDIVTG
jgi:hypothetical protein